MKIIVTLYLVLTMNWTAHGQDRMLENKRDSVITIFFRSLWIECSNLGELGDTTITYDKSEKSFFYDYDVAVDSTAVSELGHLVFLNPKIATIAACYFELKSGIKRPYKHTYALYPYLTYNIIKKWEFWYWRNRSTIDYHRLLRDIDKVKKKCKT